jgi:Na+/proline symporter
MLWKRATGWGGLAGLVIGVTSSFVMFAAKRILFVIEEPFLYVAWWSFVVSIVVIVVVSLLTAPEPPGKIEGLVYGSKMKKIVY